jgi:hypothetical protein
MTVCAASYAILWKMNRNVRHLCGAHWSDRTIHSESFDRVGRISQMPSTVCTVTYLEDDHWK